MTTEIVKRENLAALQEWSDQLQEAIDRIQAAHAEKLGREREEIFAAEAERERDEQEYMEMLEERRLARIRRERAEDDYRHYQLPGEYGDDVTFDEVEDA